MQVVLASCDYRLQYSLEVRVGILMSVFPFGLGVGLGTILNNIKLLEVQLVLLVEWVITFKLQVLFYLKH
jgi:hypothetical protein